MELTIYNKTDNPIITVSKFTYSGKHMDDEKISITVESPDAISFSVQDYVTYRGVKFVIYDDPSETKKAATGLNIGNAIKYDLEFYSEFRTLKDILFEDWVTNDDSNVYYTGTSKFSFFNNVNELAGRIQANLDRFVGDGVWSVTVDPNIELEEKQVDTENQYVWDALLMANSIFGLNFYIRGKSIQIGGDGLRLDQTFSYGKDNGLYQISKKFGSKEKVITRLKTYGAERNLPEDYLRDENAKGRYFSQLMLPNFATTQIDYVDAPASMINKYGIIEGAKQFDDVYPSIEEIVLNGGRIDEIIEVYTIDLNSNQFKVKVRDLGFNPIDYLTADTPRISIKGTNRDGNPTHLGGYEFEINDSVFVGNGYLLTLTRAKEAQTYLPDDVTKVRVGDRFVILGIAMPQSYITNAENKLLERANAYFTEEGLPQLTYDVKVDEKYIRINDLESELLPGDSVKIEDADLDVSDYFIMQDITIKYDNKILPTYDVKISNTNPKKFQDDLKVNDYKISSLNLSTNRKISGSLNKSNTETNNIKSTLTWKGIT